MSALPMDQRLRTSPLIVPLLALALLAAIPAESQQADTAIVVGIALDASNAPIPGATVTLTHLTTSVTTSVVTNEAWSVPHAAPANRRV